MEIKVKYASLCNSDKRLVDEVAEMWVDSGGDAEGVDWVSDALKARIAEIIEERKVANAPNPAGQDRPEKGSGA